MARPAGKPQAGPRHNTPLWAALATTLLCALLSAAHHWVRDFDVPGLQALELLTVDARFAVRGAQAPADDRIVILGFDDALRQAAPDAFSKRAGWARVLDAAAGYEPAVVAIDAFFAAPEEVLPPSVVEQVQGAFEALAAAQTDLEKQARAALEAVLAETRGDVTLRDASKRLGVVHFALLFFLDGEPAPADAPEPEGLRGARLDEAVAVEGPADERPPVAAYGVYASLPLLAEVAAGAGHVNIARDADGAVRRTFAVIERSGRFYAPLGLAAARSARGDDLSWVAGEPFVALGERRLPVDLDGTVHLGWLGPAGTFPIVSAAAVLDGTAPKEALKDKIVFVGFTDAARDRVTTPFDESMPGVEVHATLAHNALHGGLMRPAGAGVGLLAVVLLGLFIALMQFRPLRQRRPWLGAVGAVVLVPAYFGVAQVLFGQGLVIEMASPLLTCVAVALVGVSTALVSEGREKAKLRAAFSQYVAPALVSRIIAEPDRLGLGGERREVTVLFSDIRGFSSFSEGMQPEDLSKFLNEYLNPMTRLVLDERGMLDKYIGDAVMAVYGAPLDQPDHAAAACRTALAMVDALAPLNRAWAERGLPAIRIGVGLNTGVVSAGNMGSDLRFDYTVMGDAVNLGARLEPLTKEMGVDILVGEATRAAAGDGFVFREVDRVRVKGRDGTVRVYQLVGLAGAGALSPDDLALYAEALARYRAQDWEGAAATFEAFRARHPDDGPARVMAARIEALRKAPPGADWDGAYDQRSK